MTNPLNVVSIWDAILVLTPFVAIGAAWTLARLPGILQRVAFTTMALGCVFAAAMVALDLRLASHMANLAGLGSVHVGGAILACSAFRLHPRWLAVVLGFIASIPAVLGLAFAVMLPGWLAFGLFSSKPEYVGRATHGVTCYVQEFGNATTSIGGWDVTVTRQLPFLTFVERTIRERRHENPSYGASEACWR
jgi:hypothetical protein